MAARFDPVVAKAHLAPHIGRLRRMSYAELGDRVRKSDVETHEIAESDGTSYQIEILFLWDGKPDADIRVMGFCFINPSGRSICDDFILAPDGRFIGE
jgi:hypothetical protein